MPALDINNTVVNLKKFSAMQKNTLDDKQCISFLNKDQTLDLNIYFNNKIERDDAYTNAKRYVNSLYIKKYEFEDTSNTIIFNYENVTFIQQFVNEETKNNDIALGYENDVLLLWYVNPEDSRIDLTRFVDMIINVT